MHYVKSQLTNKFVKALEFISVIGFGLAYWKYDLKVATAVLMVLMTVFVLSAKVFREPLNKLQIGTWISVMVLGSATLVFDNDLFIKWKPTAVNALLALVFGLSHLIGDKTIAERLLANKISASKEKLRRLNLISVFYFIVVGITNLVVAYYFGTTIWVNFKLFGLLLFNMIYISWVFYFLKDHFKEIMEQLEKLNK